jgi:hypothetical protein
VPTEWLQDAFGPDGIRVTVGIEPAVERLVREYYSWVGLRDYLDPVKRALQSLLPGYVQSRLLKDRWAILVEADSGRRVRLVRSTREQAFTVAEGIRRNVQQQGVRVLDELR